MVQFLPCSSVAIEATCKLFDVLSDKETICKTTSLLSDAMARVIQLLLPNGGIAYTLKLWRSITSCYKLRFDGVYDNPLLIALSPLLVS